MVESMRTSNEPSCAGGRHSMPPLTFWARKWCPSHVWCGLPLCQF